MKEIIITTLTLFISGSVFCQQNYDKVIEVYGETSFNEMQMTNPGALELLDKYAEWGMELVASNEKYDLATPLQSIPLRSKSAESITIQEFIDAYNSANFNSLAYGFFPSNEIQVFKLSGTNYALLIQRQDTILSK